MPRQSSGPLLDKTESAGTIGKDFPIRDTNQLDITVSLLLVSHFSTGCTRNRNERF
jgi:hypothetical protein